MVWARQGPGGKQQQHNEGVTAAAARGVATAVRAHPDDGLMPGDTGVCGGRGGCSRHVAAHFSAAYSAHPSKRPAPLPAPTLTTGLFAVDEGGPQPPASARPLASSASASEAASRTLLSGS